MILSTNEIDLKIGVKMYCPKCKSLMYPKDGKFVCKCGHESDVQMKKTIVSTKQDKVTMIIDDEIGTLPKTKVLCPKCKNTEAYWVIRQMRAADEPETRIYSCTKCKHKWREN